MGIIVNDGHDWQPGLRPYSEHHVFHVDPGALGPHESYHHRDQRGEGEEQELEDGHHGDDVGYEHGGGAGVTGLLAGEGADHRGAESREITGVSHVSRNQAGQRPPMNAISWQAYLGPQCQMLSRDNFSLDWAWHCNFH